MAALRRRGGGYTLLELLIVIAIIGIAAGVLTLSMRGDDRRRLTEEGDRLAALFRMAQSEARVGGRPIRWQADLSGYRFSATGPNATAIAEELARERRWPFEVRRVATSELVFGREPLREPVEVEIATPGPVLRLSLDATGNARVSACEGVECAASR
jgi:general secretion pathway protein H